MTEVELKFEVAPPQRDALQRAVATASARKRRLKAQYFDTADAQLAAAGLSLRLRHEGNRWVQTLKASGAAAQSRLEHEVVVTAPSRAVQPALDVTRHDGTPAGALLHHALKDPSLLQPLFESDVRRTSRQVRGGGSVVEIAFDEGELRADGRAQALCELEFELLRGPFSGLAQVASHWVERHGLWLDVRSKAERGYLLLSEQRAGAETRARPSLLTRRLAPDAAVRAVVAQGLHHVLHNLAPLAAEVARPEHLHQLRVALRRLRTALRHFATWSHAIDTTWEPALAALLRELGAARDRDALAVSLLPALRSAGAPLVSLPARAAATPPGELVRAPATQRLVLALLTFAHGHPALAHEAVDPPKRDLRSLARPLLRHLHRQLMGDCKAFIGYDDALRHRTRRRLKRLRYCVEFLSPLFSAKPVKTYLSILEPAQDALGEFNDAVVAQRSFRALLVSDPQAWFALGWLAARRGELEQAASHRLHELADAPHFWRRDGSADK